MKRAINIFIVEIVSRGESRIMAIAQTAEDAASSANGFNRIMDAHKCKHSRATVHRTRVPFTSTATRVQKAKAVGTIAS